MNIRLTRFNLLFAAIAGIIVLAAGCSTTKNKDGVRLQLHQEVNSDGSDRNGPVTIGRDHPFSVNVERQAFLDERSVARAWIGDVLGGFQVLIQFDRHGTWVLEQYSVANKGQHAAILASLGKGNARWIGAPVFTQRISDGLLAFTPDATREEVEKMVKDLNKLAKETQKNNP